MNSHRKFEVLNKSIQ